MLMLFTVKMFNFAVCLTIFVINDWEKYHLIMQHLMVCSGVVCYFINFFFASVIFIPISYTNVWLRIFVDLFQLLSILNHSLVRSYSTEKCHSNLLVFFFFSFLKFVTGCMCLLEKERESRGVTPPLCLQIGYC